jgi:hypothetical protein
MHETIELPEHHEGHGDNPFTLPVTVTISILAVLVAAVTLLGHRAHTEELLLQSKATDQWAYFQAKNIRMHEMETMVDVLDTVGLQDKEKAKAVREKYEKEVERYKDDKTEIGNEAKSLEGERDLISRRADRFDGGEALLEIGLVICSITLLTRRKLFWVTGMLIGAAGVLVAVTGFFAH